MKHDMDKSVKVGLMLAVVVAVALLSAFWAATFELRAPWWEPRPLPPFDRVHGDLELFYTVKTVVSSVNITLLVFLLITYVGIYRKTRSEFTIGLIIFSLVLFFYALASHPMLHGVFGFRAVGLGPFAMLPDLFTCVALGVLLYLTVKY